MLRILNNRLRSGTLEYRAAGALLLLGALLFAAPLLGQEKFGTLTGKITDQTGGVLPNVNVTITNKDTQRSLRTTTGMDGNFSSGNLDPGTYTVKFESGAFSQLVFDDVKVLVGQNLAINRKMSLRTATTQLTVQADAPLIDTQNVQKAHNLTSEELSRLPKGRSYVDVVRMSPSVNQGDIEGGIQVNGASGGENAFNVDGVNTSSLLYGIARLDTISEYVQEVQIKLGGLNAEYGGALGGVISAITKSGSADYHGEFYYYYSGTGLSAGPVERLQLSDDTKTALHEQDNKQPIHRNEFGASIGGPLPLAKNLYFFTSVTPKIVRNTRNYLFALGPNPGVDPGTISQNQTVTQVFGKVTYLTDRVRTNGTFLTTPTRDTGRLRSYKGPGTDFAVETKAASDPLNTQGFDMNKYSASANVDITLNRASYVSFRGGYFYDNYNDNGFLLTTPYFYRTSSSGASNIPPELQGPAGTVNVPAIQIDQNDKTQRSSADTDYNLTFRALGSHVFKAGAGIERLSYDVNSSYPGGLVQIFWNVPTVPDVNNTPQPTGTYGYYRVLDQGVKGKVATNRGSFYIQDQWTVIPRLTLNVGLRTENEKVPMFRSDISRYGFQFGFGDKLAPRLGASLDLHGDGKVKLYGSWGRYFDVTRYSISRESFGGTIARGYYRSLDTLEIGTLNLNNLPGRELWGDPRGYREFIPTVTNVDAAIKPMYQDSTNAGVEYQVNRSTVFGAHYVHNNLSRTVEDIGINGSFLIGNPGEGPAAVMPAAGATAAFAIPKPKRQYDAIEFTATRRFLTNWFGSASYTYSRLFGNYPGIADSDQIDTPTTGKLIAIGQDVTGAISRPGVNANISWDAPTRLWDSKGNLDPRGRLATDRPHAFKLYGGYTFPTSTQVSFFFSALSGTPVTTYVIATDGQLLMVNGRGDLGRTPALTRTDLLISHEHKLRDAQKVRFELNILNLFNQKTAAHIFNFVNKGAPGGAENAISSSSIDMSGVNLANGYDYNAMLLARPDGANSFDPRYKLPDLWTLGLQGQFSVKFSF